MRSFDSEKHVYRSLSGRLPGATDVIKAEGLVETDWMSEEARWRGSCVHRGVELLVKGTLDWETVDDRVAGYLRSAERFLATTGFEVVGCELPCWDLAYACTPDLWGRLNGFNVAIELKTGPVPKWTALQLALQARAIKTETGFVVQKRFGLQLRSEGLLPKLIPFENRNDDHVAMGMVQSFWWKVENGYWRWND